MNNIQINHRQEGDAVEIVAVLKELTFLRQDNKFNIDPKKENFVRNTAEHRSAMTFLAYQIGNLAQGR